MQISKVSAQPSYSHNASFKAHIATLADKNGGQRIAREVVDVFNRTILPEIKRTQIAEAMTVIGKAGAGAVIQTAKDFQNKVNFFTLAAGSGSRFRPLAQTVGDYNKISLPFRVGKDENVHMLDFALAMGKYFIGDDGVQKIIASKPSGSFGDVVQHYLAGNQIKDTIVCCGDNVFGGKASEMMEFFTRTINNPKKHVALVGVGRTPEEVANRFGVLDVVGSFNDTAMKLRGFSEKPPIEEARKLAIDNQNVANTGLFYLSKDSMTKLIDEIKNGVNNIKKNDAEPFDFAYAVKYVHSKLPEWFGIASQEGADVKVVKTWEDVGEPKALYAFADAVKKGEFLENFPAGFAKRIQASFNDRIHLDAKTPHILFTPSTKVSQKAINTAKDIEGVKIVV